MSGLHFHMAVFVVEIRNQSSDEIYILNNCRNAIFVGAPSNLEGTKYFDLPYCHNHLFTKPNICVLSSDTLLIPSFTTRLQISV